ncbi:hypothetical protein B0H11DRAFT_2282117 [Mycena galericulata]|nr:hypothetical protein B0H11DRAFT_2282117 [Mycena galericulata]
MLDAGDNSVLSGQASDRKTRSQAAFTASDQVQLELLANEKYAAQERVLQIDYWEFLPLPEDPPLSLLRVCHAWRTLALSTPALWAKLQWYIHGPEDVDIIDTWISRCGACPLDLTTSPPTGTRAIGDPLGSALFDDVVRLFRKHLHRFNRLRLRTYSPGLLVPLINGAPRLHTLSVDNGAWADAEPDVDLGALPSLRLSRCPALLECDIGFSRNREFPAPSAFDVTPVTLLSLTTLQVWGHSRAASEAIFLLFSALTLPALRELDIQLWISVPLPSTIGPFLWRSRCPLQKILLIGFGNVDPAEVVAWLHPVTATLSVVTLYIDLGCIDPLLSALTNSGSRDDLCPHLTSFRLFETAWWTGGMLATMVESRWRNGAPARLDHIDCRFLAEPGLEDLPRICDLHRRGLDVWLPGT